MPILPLLAWPVLLAYGAFVALGVFSPTPEVASGVVARMSRAGELLGLPPGLTSLTTMQLAANVVVTVPFPVLIAATRLPRISRWGWSEWTAWTFVVSGSVEVVQAFFLPARSATYLDVVANTSGGLAGGLLVSLAFLAVRDHREAYAPEHHWSGSSQRADR